MSDTERPGRTDLPVDTGGDAFIEVEGLEKYYDVGGIASKPPVRAVDGVDLSIRRGETLGLVGESGCGKTTLGRTLARLESPTGGSIHVEGMDEDLAELSRRELRGWQRRIGMVFQDPGESLNDRMTVGEVIREPLDAHSWGVAEDRVERVLELLDAVGLNEEHYYRYPHQFSGGQLQRIAIARALALEPEFVVLDEPTSALDVSVQARIVNLLADLQEEMDLTYLFITHDLSVIRHLADRVAVMYLGNVVERGPTEAVFEAPEHPYTISLLSAIPGTHGTRPTEHRTRITLRGTPPSPRDPPQGCPFTTRCPAKIRPDGVDLSDDAWAALESFRVVLRQRARSERSVTEAVRQLVGVGSADDVREIRADLFEDVALPDDVAATVSAAVDRAAGGDDRGAARLLREEFGSVCDREFPDDVDVGDGRTSRCLRHGDPDYRDAQAVIDERAADD